MISVLRASCFSHSPQPEHTANAESVAAIAISPLKMLAVANQCEAW